MEKQRAGGKRGSPEPSEHLDSNHSPPIEPDNVVAMAWTAVFAFSNDSGDQNPTPGSGSSKSNPSAASAPAPPPAPTSDAGSMDRIEHRIGDDVIASITKMAADLPTDSPDRPYLFELNNLFLDALRTLSNRLVGMWQSFQTTNQVEEAKVKEAQSLGSITGDVSSLVPRVGATVGGASASSALSSVLNALIPTVAGISGYELVFFGAFVGYFAIELILRYYSYWEVPRAILKGQRERSQAYNTFLRQSKETLTNLALEAIRLREQFYPHLGTIGKTRFYYSSTAGIKEKEQLHTYVSDLVQRLVPVVHDSARLSMGLVGSGAKFVRRVEVAQGQQFLMSYSAEADREVTLTVTSESKHGTVEDFPPQSAGEFTYFAEQDDVLELEFRNPSWLRSKRVAYGVQVVNLDDEDFLPRS